MAFLEDLGITEAIKREARIGDIYEDVPYLRIPYYNPVSSEIAERHRLSLSGGKRFLWRKNDTPYLYGTEKLNDYTRCPLVLSRRGGERCAHASLSRPAGAGAPRESVLERRPVFTAVR